MLITKEKAIALLKEGSNLAIPTETVYGLAGRYDSEAAIENIFQIKARPKSDPLICHISNLSMLESLCDNPSPLVLKLAKDFWPGPLTIVCKKSDKISDLITAGQDDVAIRMPNHSLCLEVIEAVGSPICAPSANRFGKTSPTCVEHIEKEYNNAIAVLDGGPCDVGIESTIVRLHQDKIEILRPGKIRRKDFLAKSYLLSDNLNESNMPGSRQDHYKPSAPFYLLKEENLNRLDASKNLKQWILEDSAEDAARNLYKNMLSYQESAKEGFYTIYKADLGDSWTAIWDRLKKASYRKDLF